MFYVLFFLEIKKSKDKVMVIFAKQKEVTFYVLQRIVVDFFLHFLKCIKLQNMT